MKESIKSEIKSLSEEQKILRDQRKTKYNKFPRTVDAGVARGRHMTNRYKLYHLFILYAEVRNRELPVSEKDGYSRSYVDKLREEYSLKKTA